MSYLSGSIALPKGYVPMTQPLVTVKPITSAPTVSVPTSSTPTAPQPSKTTSLVLVASPSTPSFSPSMATGGYGVPTVPSSGIVSEIGTIGDNGFSLDSITKNPWLILLAIAGVFLLSRRK